jgi:hypothetical protein
MRAISNICGAKNPFGFYDVKAREIVLRHPYTKKHDVEEAYMWIEEATDLQKLAIGIGAVENFVIQDNNDTLYKTARQIVKQRIMQVQMLDNEILKNILMRLKNNTMVQNLSLKGYIFEGDNALFNELLNVIKALPNLSYFDVTGSYFSDEQLIVLADVLSHTHLAHLVWPEARLSDLTIRTIMMKLKNNRSIVIMRGVPLEFQDVARQNRLWLFNMVRQPSLVTADEKNIIKEFASSYRLAIAYEKQRFFDIEKSVEAILA